MRPFPKGKGQWMVSTDGGWHPQWSRDSGELFYRNGDRMMVVDYAVDGDTFVPGPPRLLFEVPTPPDVGRATYDVTADGQRFLVLLPAEGDEAQATQLTVVLNWFEELKRLVPSEN